MKGSRNVKKFSLKKKIIIGIMSFLLICILSLFGLAYIAISGLSEAMADSFIRQLKYLAIHFYSPLPIQKAN